jgi:ABC-2 type transport system ATP-binding protein
LAEIESFSTHVGFMDDGRMLLSESMANVHARIRRVTAAHHAPPSTPASPPAAWLRFESNANISHWIETDYDADRSTAKAREFFGPVELSTQSLTLREVFLALARPNHPLIPGEVSQ